MRSSLLVTMGVLLASVAGCGNLSNEDLLFVAALPDQALRIDPPSDDGSATQALGGNDYKRATDLALIAAAKINLFTDDVLDHVSEITLKRPTTRQRGKRVWGPMKVRKTGLTARLTMERVTSVDCEVSSAPLDAEAPAYQWSIELNRASTGDYVGVITGTSRGYDFSHSCGTLNVDVKTGKVLGLRVDDPQLKGIDSIQIGWERVDDDASISAKVVSSLADDALVNGLTYTFERHSDGGGVFSFVIFTDVRAQQSTERYQAVLQWKHHGRPWRADFCMTPQGASSMVCGTSCGPTPGDREYLDVPGSAVHDGTEEVCGGLTYRDPRTSMN